MRVPASLEFEAQRAQYALRFACEDCVHFERTQQVCSLSYPCRDHRRERYVWPYGDIVFCKAFELA